MFTTYDLRDFIEGLAKILAIGYWGGLLLLLAVLVPTAYKQPKKCTNKILLASTVAMGILWLFLWFIPKQLGPSKEEIRARQEWDRKYKEAEAVFNEQCKKAGEKIYRTVDNVEGIMLLKIIPNYSDSENYNPMWAYAALKGEAIEEDFIKSFLENGNKRFY